MSQDLTILVDGAIFSAHKRGGILRLYQELLPRLLTLDELLTIRLVTMGNAATRPPQDARLSWVRVPDVRILLRPGRLFNGWLTPALQRSINRYYAEPHKGQLIWHPTYYSLPWTKRRSKVVITVYDMIHEKYPVHGSNSSARDVVTLKRLCIEQADTIICISQTTAEELCEYYPATKNKIRVIYIGQAVIGEPPSEIAHPKEKPFLLYVGQRDAYKNFRTLLTAYGRWQHRGEVGLHVVGPEWSSDEHELLAAMDCRFAIVHHGQVGDIFLSSLYKRATALIYPSLFEGFGLPLVEAMAVGCPIVASCIPSTTEVAAQYPIYFSAEDAEDLSRALTEVLSRGRSDQLSTLGRNSIARYSWDECARQTLQVYRE